MTTIPIDEETDTMLSRLTAKLGVRRKEVIKDTIKYYVVKNILGGVENGDKHLRK